MSRQSINNPQKTYTLNQFIALRDSESITYPKFSVLERSLTNSSLVYSIDNVIYTYMDEFDSIKKIVTVTENERQKYMYKPKLLAYDLYSSIESYFILLAINNMCNAKEFDLIDYKFYALYPSDLSSIMGHIYAAEKSYLELNRSSLGIYES